MFVKKKNVEEYYRNKRKENYESGRKYHGYWWRHLLHPVLLGLLRLNRILIDRQKITVLKKPKEKKKNSKPVIYAITHIGKYDYQIVTEVIRKHQYPFSGDPETLYHSFDGMILWLNGLIYCDTEDKTDRQIAAKTAVELLKQGINLLIYPEGIWNVTPNRLVLPLFAGVIKMAYQTGVNIIPIAIEQYGKEFVVNIGEEFCVPVCEAAEEEYKFYIEKKRKELRDVMATLKWEILESRPMANRDALGVYEYEHAKRVRAILSEWCNPKTKHPYYNSQIIAERTYRE